MLTTVGMETTEQQEYLLLGDIVPDFNAESSLGEINFYKYIEGKWCILFSHPADFTPVCTTELGATSSLAEEFKKRNCLVSIFIMS